MSETQSIALRGEDAQGSRNENVPQSSAEGPELKAAVVVLGMHRSGTSLCMNVLKAMGIRIDEDLMPGDEHNERGYFESQRIVELNESILVGLGANWHTFLSLSVGDGWENNPILDPAKQRLMALVKARIGQSQGVWGFKDPRISLMLPLYDQVLAACRVEPQYVLCIRDPRSVATSLMRRNGFPYLFSELLWLEYTLTAARVAGNRLKAVVEYENWFQDGIKQAELLGKALGLSCDVAAGSLRAEVEAIVAPALNHGDYETRPFELTCTESIYQLVQEGSFSAAVSAYAEVQEALALVARSVLYHDKSEHRGASVTPRITCQLFWCTTKDDAFHESDSSRVELDVSPIRRIVQLPIPKGLVSLSRLRLDPVNLPGLAQLFAIRLFNSEGGVVWEWDKQPGSLLAGELRNVSLFIRGDEPGVVAHFHNIDPNLVLPLTAELEGLSEKGGMLEFEMAWLAGI